MREERTLAEQVIPYAASVEVEVGRGRTVAEAVKKKFGDTIAAS